MKLSEDLSNWRIDRPDEWKMDEFIRNAEKLEQQNAELVAMVERLNNFSNERIARAATLRSCIEKILACEELVFNSDVVLVVSSELADDIRCALDSTPAQHLRDRDAGAGRDIENKRIGFIAGYHKMHIERIRGGEK